MTVEEVLGVLGPYAIKYADAIWGRLSAESAFVLDDAELNRILGPCVGGHFLVPAAKQLRDAGLLYFDGFKLRLLPPCPIPVATEPRQ